MKTKVFTLLILTLPLFCSSQILWDDFEQTRIGYYEFVHGGMTTRFVNPDPSSSINNSPLCSQYVRNPGELWDVMVIVANGPMYDVSDYVNGNKKMSIDIFSPAAGIPVQITLEDSSLAGATNYPTGRHSIYLGTTTVTNEWETIELNFDSKPDPSMSDIGLTSVILLFNGGTNTNDTYYFDNLYAPDFDNQCDGNTSDPETDFADWDCNWNLTYGYMSGWLNQRYNPDNSSINSSKYVGEYTRNPDASGEDVLISNFTSGNIDLSTDNIFRFKVYGPPRPFFISFQDANENEVIGFNSVITSNNQWKQFVYDLSSVASQSISRFVLFFDQGVVNWDLYYIDDFNISSIPSSLLDIKETKNLVVFPQPAKNEITIEMPLITNNKGILHLFDLKGELILSREIGQNHSNNRLTLDVSEINSGIYLLKFQSDNAIQYQKIQLIK